VGSVQAFGHLSAAQMLFNQQTIDAPHHVRFHRFNHHLGGTAVAFRPVTVPGVALRPGPIFPAPGFLQTSAARTCEHLGAFRLGHHPLQLGEQFALGGIAKRVVQNDHGHVKFRQLLDQEPLMGLLTGESIR
jgi:hypothetical protein